MPNADYSAFVTRFSDRWEAVTGRTVFYVDATHAAGYCPACVEGTIMVAFRERPRPTALLSSRRLGRGLCSAGCVESEIAEALR